MTTAKQNPDCVEYEMDIDVEALLQAIHQRTSGEIHEFVTCEQTVGGFTCDAYSELAQAFELDIRDYAITEVHR